MIHSLLRTGCICLVLSISSAHAQQYVPVTIDEQNFKGLQNYLGEQPAKFSTPLINWLNVLESKAAADKAAADKAFEQKPAVAAPEPKP
jgi:hypothetical protein